MVSDGGEEDGNWRWFALTVTQSSGARIELNLQERTDPLTWSVGEYEVWYGTRSTSNHRKIAKIVVS